MRAMKKLIASFCLLLSAASLHALPVGNPADPMLYTNNFYFDGSECWNCFDWIDLRLGFYGDYVFDRNLQYQSDIDERKPRDVRIITNAGSVTLNFFDWFDIFGVFGAMGIHQFENEGASQDELVYSTRPCYSGGGRITFWQCDCFYLGAQGQYLYSETQFNSITDYNPGTMIYQQNAADKHSDYGEWQASVACTYMFVDSANFSLLPYAALQFAGVKWQRNHVLSDGTTLLELEQQKLVGWTIGMTALLCDMGGVSVEARFGNEKAMSVLGQLSF